LQAAADKSEKAPDKKAGAFPILPEKILLQNS
jgi:hypothetical protein